VFFHNVINPWLSKGYAVTKNYVFALLLLPLDLGRQCWNPPGFSELVRPQAKTFIDFANEQHTVF
jgi:hypothetical protein